MKLVQKLVRISKIGITYNTPTYIYFWYSLVQPVKIFLVKSPPIWNFTTLPDAASLLRPCDARTLWGELRLLFFYCTMNSFPTVNSLPTVNSMMHTLQLHPMYCTHYVWRAPLALFLLYHELFSDHQSHQCPPNFGCSPEFWGKSVFPRIFPWI